MQTHQYFYNPVTDVEKAYASFPKYITLTTGGVKQKNSLSDAEWGSLNWYPMTIATVPDGHQAIEPWSYTNNGDGTYTSAPVGWAPIPEPAPTVRYILFPLEFQSRFTTAEKRAVDAVAEVNDDIYEIKAAFRSAIEIDLQSPTTQTAMSGLVSAGIITEERKVELLTPII